MSADSAQSGARRRVRVALRPLLALAAVVAALGAAQLLRSQLGIEWSAESIQQTVRGFGLWAEIGFVVLVVFRQRRCTHGHAPTVHVVQESNNEAGDQVGPHRPTCAEIAEHDCHVWHP